jgi:tetratricopeptide (TPR) repeat protein
MDVYLTCLVAIDVKNGNSDDSGNENENENDSGNDNQQKSTCTNSTSSAISSATTSESTNTIKIDIDKEEKNHNDDNEEEQEQEEEQQWRKKIDDEIKLPVLMNLSACTLKLGMHRKTVSFCNMALEMESGCINPKVHFRRGKSHMLMGLYNYARADFHQSLALLEQSNDNNDDNKNNDNGKSNDDYDDYNDERKLERTRQIEAVNKELVHLKKLVESAEKNRKRHKKAMKLVLGGGSGDNNKSSISRISSNHSADNNNTICQISPHHNDNDNINHIEGSTAITVEPIEFVEANGNNDQGNHHQGSLYADVNTTREYSTLRAKPRRKKQRFATRSSLDKNDKTMTFAQQGVPSSSSSSSSSPTATRRYFVWYMKMIEQGLRKTLYWLGDEEAMTRSFDDDEEVKEKIM